MDTSHLASLLSNIRLETSDLEYSVNQLVKNINAANKAHDVLSSSGFLPLVSLSTKTTVLRLYSGGIQAILCIPWRDRTKARHTYGSCFPENHERQVYVRDNSCEGPQILEAHCFDCDNNKISVNFYRETFAGDMVNGCEVKSIYRDDRSKYEYPKSKESHLAIVCPI